MRKFLLAMSVFSGFSTQGANAEALIKKWQTGGTNSWTTILVRRSDGLPQCWTMYDGVDLDKASTVAFIFVMDPVGARLQIYGHTSKMAISNANIIIDDEVKFTLNTISSSEFNSGKYITTFDMPADSYAKQILPAMVGHRSITIESEGRTFITEIGNFIPVISDTKECAALGRQQK